MQFHRALKWAPEAVKTYFSNIESLPSRGANKNLQKRQLILEFHKAGQNFTSSYFESIQKLIREELEADTGIERGN